MMSASGDIATMSASGDITTMSASGDMRVQDATDFGHIIRDARKKRGLNQQQLADLIGVSRQWISEVENGKPRAELQLVLTTLNYLQVRLHTDPRPADPASPFANMPDIDINAIVDQARRP